MYDNQEDDMFNDQKIIKLSNKDFDQNMNLTSHPRKKAVILFYSPFCGHCKVMHPEYIKAAKQNIDGNTIYAVVDSSKNPELMKKVEKNSRRLFNVQGVPTMVSYDRGQYFSTYGMCDENKRTFRTAGDINLYSRGIGDRRIISWVN